MLPALAKNYITKEDMYEFIKPAFSSPHESLTREIFDAFFPLFKWVRPAVKYGLEQSGK